MTTTVDVIVLGLGGMGSAAVYHLAARGTRVLGLDQHAPVHSYGSSHGQSRIIRQAYFEDPAYVPLVLRAYELWEQLERDADTPLLRITGGLMIGSPHSAVVAGSLRSAQDYNIRHDLLHASEIHRRFPPLTPPATAVGLYEHQAGFLAPEAAVRAHLTRAVDVGATLQFHEPVLAWEASAGGDGVRVTTTRGRYEAARLVIAPGAWAPDILADFAVPLQVERQVMCWFDPIGGIAPFLPDRFPIYIWELDDGTACYGFPAHAGPRGGVKAALHHGGDVCTPHTIDRDIRTDDIERVRRTVAERVPALNSTCLHAVTCMYTNTPDHHFVVATHPRHAQVVIAAGFSGHGFKFASVIGEILADVATDGTTQHPINLFTPQRFS